MIGEKQINKLLKTQMSRKQFLRHTGLAVLSIIGVKNMVDSITQPDHHSAQAPSQTNGTRKFGNGKYGR